MAPHGFAEPEKHSVYLADDRASATGFITRNSAIPAHADTSKGDVPRDSYGRPWTYEGLGKSLPAFSARTTDNQRIRHTQFEGRWTVLQIWGIWCHDSLRDAPYAAALATAIEQDPDLDFLTLHTPYNAKTAKRGKQAYVRVADWLTEKGYTYPTLVDEDASLRDVLKIRWTPSYLLIGPDLSVQGFRTGLSDAGDMAVKQFIQDIATLRADWDTRQGR